MLHAKKQLNGRIKCRVCRKRSTLSRHCYGASFLWFHPKYITWGDMNPCLWDGFVYATVYRSRWSNGTLTITTSISVTLPATFVAGGRPNILAKLWELSCEPEGLVDARQTLAKIVRWREQFHARARRQKRLNFSRSLLRSENFWLQSCAILRKAVRMPNRRIT